MPLSHLPASLGAPQRIGDRLVFLFRLRAQMASSQGQQPASAGPSKRPAGASTFIFPRRVALHTAHSMPPLRYFERDAVLAAYQLVANCEGQSAVSTLATSLSDGSLAFQLQRQAETARAAIVVEGDYPDLFRTQPRRGSWLADMLVRLLRLIGPIISKQSGHLLRSDREVLAIGHFRSRVGGDNIFTAMGKAALPCLR